MPDDKNNPYNEEEAARRRADASRRARKAPEGDADRAGKRDSERPGKRDADRAGKRPGRAGPEKYRGVEYSVARRDEGTWIWKLRGASESGAPAPTGTVRGRQDDAIEAAHRAIDKALGTRPK